MSNIDRMTSTSNLLESTFANQDLFVDLTQKDAETISGGYEVFQIKNNTKYNITHILDGHKDKPFLMKPGETWTYTAHQGGNIEFDVDSRNEYQLTKKYNLSNGGVYEFQDNKSTPGNPYDIELYSVA